MNNHMYSQPQREPDISPVKVVLTDDGVTVSCENGDFPFGSLDEAWRWVLHAIRYPADYAITIVNKREDREHLAT
jgi:hypothetical protein